MGKRSAQYRPRGGKSAKRKIRREARILQAVLDAGVDFAFPEPPAEPIWVSDDEEEGQALHVPSASSSSARPSFAPAVIGPPSASSRAAPAEPDPLSLRISSIEEFADLPPEDFRAEPLSLLFPPAAREDVIICRADEDIGTLNSEGFFAGAFAIDFYNTLAYTERRARHLGRAVSATPGNAVPIEHLRWLSRVYQTGTKAILLTFVGKRASAGYINDLITSGICKIFSATIVVTSKGGPRGKGAVCRHLGLPTIVDDSDEVVEDCASRGIWTYHICSSLELPGIPVDRLLS